MIANWIPWWAKLAAKVVLARLPVGYSLWKNIGIFVHGQMERPDVAIRTFMEHAATGGLSAHSFVNLSVLEVGPGDSVATGVIAKSLGARQCWLVDSSDFARRDVPTYLTLASALTSAGHPAPWARTPTSFDELLSTVDAKYETGGLKSFAILRDHAIDFLFSNAVLEHVRRMEFPSLVAEMFRVLAPSGVAVHRVDLKDHLGGALNNLRFPSTLWEQAWFANSGFYTNRIRLTEMVGEFQRAGFNVEVPRVVKWTTLPTPRRRMAREFQHVTDDELLISGFDIVLRKPQRAGSFRNPVAHDAIA